MKTDIRIIRALLVDDHINIHKTVSRILDSTEDIKLVGQGANGQEALDLCERLLPDIILMDILMPVMDGIQSTKLIHEKFSDVKILALSSYHDNESVRFMLQNGAIGYIIKTSLLHDLVDTIRAVVFGKVVFSEEVFNNLMVSSSSGKNFHLTDREFAVLKLMAKGLNNPEIASALFIAQTTVKYHIGNICTKLGTRTRSEALIVAAKNNLI